MKFNSPSLMNLARTLAACAAFAALALHSACGGGVETGGTGSTSYVQGPISGFGSVWVAGIRFDDDAARVEDAEGGQRSREDLRLGMVVEVEAGPIAGDGAGNRSAAATRIRLGSELLGPVTALGSGGASIAVLGQQLRLTATTVFDGASAATLALGDIVEVHGFFDAGAMGANYTATRVERRDAAPAQYRVRGIAREIDAAARTLRIGTQVFDLAAIGLPAGLADGQFVRLAVQKTPVSGRWVAASAAVESRRLDDRAEAELEGLVTAFASAARFSVNGVAVDASAAAVPAGVALGARVKVRGRAAAGGVVAASVELRGDGGGFDSEVDLRETIANLDRGASTFTLRGVVVYYGAAPRYDGGSEADLANGRRVRVRGTLDADRTRVRATRIEFVS